MKRSHVMLISSIVGTFYHCHGAPALKASNQYEGHNCVCQFNSLSSLSLLPIVSAGQRTRGRTTALQLLWSFNRHYARHYFKQSAEGVKKSEKEWLMTSMTYSSMNDWEPAWVEIITSRNYNLLWNWFHCGLQG